MKQTAVEFLIEMFDLKSEFAIIDQAKKMEKQQQGYSEEEAVNIFFLGRESLNKPLITKEEALGVIQQFKKK